MAEKTSRAFAAHEQGTVVKDWTFPLRPMEDHDVEIKITHCGMCASDIHTINGDWGKMPLPIVVGHEIIGHVTAVGKGVTKHKIGDRVGVGPQQLSCFNCNQCKKGKEVYCTKQFVATYGGGSTYPNGYISKGGYAEFHRVHEHFAIPIPASIPSEKAAPLLCAGITVYSPLRRFHAGPGKKVGVIGIGGLGHLAIQFASKLGATVTAISTSKSKEAEARQLGADNFIVLEDTEAMFNHAGELDLLINTASHSHDVLTLMTLLSPEGTFLQLGGGQGEIKVDSFSLLFKGQSVAGSLVGSPDQISEMLTLCAKHHIYPMTEVIPLAKVNEGIQAVLANKPRYRLVLDIQNHYK